MKQRAGDHGVFDPFEVSTDFRRRLPPPNRMMAPVLWFGGKGNLAPWVVKHIPDGKVYCEPFCGAASVFWHLPCPRPVEVLNDLDGELVNLFRVLQDADQFRELAHRLVYTPYSLAEFERALEVEGDTDPITRAWAFFVRQNQGFGGKAKTTGNWGRVFVAKRGTAGSVAGWRARLTMLDYWHERLMRVQLDCRPAIEVIRYWDTPDTVFYLDPPYIHAARTSSNDYAHEMTGEQHEELVDALLGLSGRAVLSGYASPVYERLEAAGWARFDCDTSSHAAGRVRNSGLQGEGSATAKVRRTESLWLSPRAARAYDLFGLVR